MLERNGECGTKRGSGRNEMRRRRNEEKAGMSVDIG